LPVDHDFARSSSIKEPPARLIGQQDASYMGAWISDNGIGWHVGNSGGHIG
jgi:hypothetical protein